MVLLRDMMLAESISVEIQASGVTALGILFAVLSGHAMLMRPFRA